MTSHLRPPRHPGRGVGRVPAPHRRAAPGRRRLLRRRLRGARPRRASSRARPGPAADRPPASRVPPRPRRRAAPGGGRRRCSRRSRRPPSLVKAYRMHGHLAAHLDPLGSEPLGDPGARPRDRRPDARGDGADPGARAARSRCPGETLAEALPHLRGDLLRHDRLRDRAHLRPRAARLAAPGDRVRRLPPAARRRGEAALLERLTEVEALETLPAQGLPRARSSSRSRASTCWCRCSTRRSSSPAEAGAREVVIGMAHRGRLNVLAHTVGRPYEAILAEFEGEQTRRRRAQRTPEGGTGDVKYHHGAAGTYTHARRARRRRSRCRPTRATSSSWTRWSRAARAPTRPAARARELAPRPDGGAAGPDPRRRRLPRPGRRGRDAQPAGARRLRDRRHAPHHRQQPDRLHDRPEDARSTRYASDLAKGFDIPIIHVNADDAEACIAAVRLAMAYRDEFARDVLIDLIGYRRFGHNEADEPAYTQPLMYERDQEAPAGAQALRASSSSARAWSPSEEAERIARRRYQRLSRGARRSSRTSMGGPPRDRRARSSTAARAGAATRRVAGRDAARAQRAAAAACPRASRPPQAASRSSSAAARRSGPTAASTGRTPRRWRSRRC